MALRRVSNSEALQRFLFVHTRGIETHLRRVTGRTYNLYKDGTQVSDQGMVAIFRPAERTPVFKLAVTSRDNKWDVVAGYRHHRVSLRTSNDNYFEATGLDAIGLAKLLDAPGKMFGWVPQWWGGHMRRTALMESLVGIAHSESESRDELLDLILKHR